MASLAESCVLVFSVNRTDMPPPSFPSLRAKGGLATGSGLESWSHKSHLSA